MPRDDRSLDVYLREIGKISPLTLDEEAMYAKHIRQGDEEALKMLVLPNLRFVVTVANHYVGSGLPLLDLIEAGNLGLLKAAKRFDATRGFKFCSYAVWWIRQAIMQAIDREGGIVRLPANQMTALGKARRKALELTQTLEREPTVEELAEVLEEVSFPIGWLLGGGGRGSSIDRPVGDDDDERMSDYLVDENAPRPDDKLKNETLGSLLGLALSGLNAMEQNVLRLHFGIGFDHPYSIEEIAMQKGLTRTRIRQLLRSGLKCLREGPYHEALWAELH